MLMEKEDIRSVGFDQLGDMPDIDYKDSDIAFHNDLKELPVKKGHCN